MTNSLMSLRGYLGVLLVLVTTAGCADEKYPGFDDYSVKELYRGESVAVVLETEQEQMFQTRLRGAAKLTANFAGEYVLTAWGCGATCSVVAAVSLKSGRVVFFPGTICCNQSEFKAIEYQVNSRMLIVTGYINEDGLYGRHYFEIKDDFELKDEESRETNFRFLKTEELIEFPSESEENT